MFKDREREDEDVLGRCDILSQDPRGSDMQGRIKDYAAGPLRKPYLRVFLASLHRRRGPESLKEGHDRKGWHVKNTSNYVILPKFHSP